MKRYHFFLLVVFLATWVWAAIHPATPANWFHENIPVFIFVPIIIVIGQRFRLSKLSYLLITLFLILHLVGTHYNYGHVPFGYWLGDVLGIHRNMYDRLLHFLFGFLIAYPIREVFLRVAHAKGFWSYYLPLDVILSFSALFEIVEWLGVTNMTPEEGYLYIGGNDPWDAQKDMLIAGAGALLAMLIIALIKRLRGKKVWREIRKSLQVDKGDVPLDDREIHTLLP